MNAKIILVRAMPMLLFVATTVASALGASIGLKTVWGEVPAIC